MRLAAAPAPRLVGLALLILGAVGAVETLRIRDDWTGARLLPAFVSLALLALGVAHLRAAPAAPEAPAPAPGAPRIGVVVAVLVGYVAALSPLGFLPATAGVLLVLLRHVGRYRWPVAVALGAGLALAAHLVFKVWLGMPLPDGLLGR